MPARENCFAYSEQDRIEYVPRTWREIKVKHLECKILRRMYCTFEDCNFFKTQKFLDEERAKCERRWKRIREEKEHERKQQTEGQTGGVGDCKETP